MKIRVENQRKKLKVQNPGRHLLLFSFLLSIIFTSCEKDPTEFGSDLLPGQDSVGIVYDESFDLSTYLIRSDSFNTSNPNMPVMVGSYTDPFFGQTNASFAAKFGLSSYNPDLPDNAVADSIKLIIRVDSVYGYKNMDLNLFVFKLNEELGTDFHYSNENPDNYYSSSDLISEETTNIKDSIYEVRLSQDFANHILSLDSVSLSNDSSFTDKIPGIFCRSQLFNSPGGQIINGSQAYLRINLYYHTETDTSTLILANGYQPKANFISQDFSVGLSGVERAHKYLNNDPTQNDSLLFINNLGGTRAKIQLPDNLDSLLNNRMISKAVFEFKNINSYNALPADSTFSLFKYDSEDSYIRISAEGKLYNDNIYRINVTEYIQYLVKGVETDHTIYLNSSKYKSSLGQMVLGGVNSATPPKLKIRYYDNPPE